jgi:hypothetical protein
VLRLRRNSAKVNGVLITVDIAVRSNRVASQWKLVKEALRQMIRRRLDEPKLELGETISIKEGVSGVVVARYIPSGRQKEVCYIVEVLPDEGNKRQT